MEKILLIDDQEKFCIQVQKTLALRDYPLRFATDAKQALALALNEDWDVILLDVDLNHKLDGLDILKKVIHKKSHLPIIMISGASTLHTAVKATQIGAYDFLEKPLNVDLLLITLKRALEKNRLSKSNKALSEQMSKRFRLIGQSAAIHKILNEVDQIAKTDVKVFIWGESGVGKDILAKIIHYRSEREAYPLIAINCAAIPESLVESELFGYEKGAFTGADEHKKGLIAQAEGGTLYLDEITELPNNSQAKLLKFLQDGQYCPLGSDKSIQSNIRIIASTNKNIHEEIKRGRFRQDLFYRLNVVNLYIPPLRERKEDIPLLADFFLHQACMEFGKHIANFCDDAMELIQNMNWMGNVRQLKSAIDRMVLFANNNFIDYGTAATAIQMDRTNKVVTSENSYRDALREFEKLYFMNLLYTHKGDLDMVAKIASLPKSTLKTKMAELNISKP